MRIEQLERENARLRQAEPIAILGMACRFPGGVDSPRALWELLSAGGDAVSEVPAGRWPLARFYDADPDAPGKTYSRHGGFLRGPIDLFDAAFFGISPLEARALDPQQRLLLEVSWEALENAGLPAERLRGSRTGVFVGISGSDYLQAQLRGGPERIGPYDATGAIGSTAVGRIAYTFDFRGPALAVDTACSSSLVALDQACASLRQGSSDLALAGGVNLILGPEGSICFARMKALSASGRCRTFDAGADGFVRSEGCGVVVLKRLAEARRAGDPVLAVLRGSAVNQDGRSNGLTAPNLLAQREVIRRALEQAGAGPLDVSYVEAHGTGTPLGDPIEVEALSDVLCAGRREPLLLGSVKTNLGHLEAAAGMAGLFKVVLALQHGEIPPNLHLERPSPHIPWAGLPIRVPVQRTAWAAGDRPRLAGLSSFGFGGTNGHVVVAEAPPPEAPAAEPGSRPSHYLLCLSAKSEPALGRLADAYAGVLAEEPEIDPGEICAGANAGRSHFHHRLAVVGASAAELRQRLGGVAGVTGAGAAPARGAPPVVFLFTGQGSQYPGMARDLYRSEPRFRSVLERCNDLLEPRLGRSIVDILDPERPEAALLSEASYLQPALFAVEYALASLWRAWGVEPAAMAGHSVGEIVAACLAGVFSLEDALALVAERGRLVDSLPRRGRMATVFAGEGRVAEELAFLGHGADGDLVIAAVNGPAQVVVAGIDEAVEAALAHFRERGLRARPLAATHAFHSPLLDPILPAFERAAAALHYGQPSIPVVSNLTGEGGADMANARYWVEHLRRPVRFAGSLAWLLGQGHRVFLEIGPAATLTALGKQVAPEATWLASLRKGQPDRLRILSSAAELYVRGVDFDWPELGRPRRFPTLPNYPFERQSYWFEGGEMGLQGENMSASESPGNVPSARRETILASLKQVVSDSSGLAQPGIDVHRNLLEMGLDSLMLMQVRQEIGRSYGVEIPVSEFFQGLETLDKLANYLAEQAPAQREQSLPVASPAPAMPQTPTPPTPVMTGHTSLERLMEQQLQAMSQLVAQQLAAFKGATASPVQALVAVDAVAVPPASGAPETFVPYRRINTEAETLTDERKRAHLGRLVARYSEATGPSKERTQADRPVFANNRNIAGFRPAWKERVYQIIAERAEGSRIWAVGGREYIDLTMGFGVHLFGHQPPFLTAAIEREMRQGMPLGPMSHLAGRVAREIRDMTGVERVAFYNTGTEAVMVALRIARTVTGRTKVVLFEGSYHGGFDGVLAAPRYRDGVLSTVPGSPGTTQGMVDDVLVLKYGDPESLARIRASGHELAAVLVEPVQSRRPDLRPREFLSELRRITAECGAALVFDEMVLGFRLEPGGAQAYFDVRADLVTYGKVIGGGMPIGIVAGRADFMDAVDGGMWSFGDDSYPRKRNTFVAGTFCHHPLSLAAALAVLEHLRTSGPSLQEELNRTTARFCQRLNDFFGAEEVPIRVEPCGSLFRFFLRGDLDLLFYHLIEKGIYIWEGRNCFLSTAHTEDDLEQVYQAVVDSIHEMRRGGFIAELPAELSAARAVASAAPVPVSAAPAGSGRPMEFSLFYFSSADGAGTDKYRLLLAGARYADRHGFTAIWTPERHFHDFGGLYPNPSITGAALATITERIRIRAGSTVLLLHNPVRFAENWSMVDNLSGGRVDLAVALGWNSNDFFFAPETFEKRSDLLPERLETVRRLWRGETLAGKGGRGEEVRIQLHPKPVQPDLAIWFPASGNPETFVHAGKSGVNVLTYLEGQTVEELGQKIALYRQARRQHGHEPHGHVTLMLHTLVGEDESAVLQMARPHLKTYLMSSFFLRSQLVSSLGMDLNGIQPKDLDVLLDRAIDRYLADRALIGTPDSCVAMIERLRAIGVDEVGCLIDFGIDFESTMAGLALLDQVRERCQARSVAASPDRLPLSAGQRELWAFVQTSPEASLAYNESVMLRLAGPLDRPALQSAVERLIERHQALRLVEPDGTSQKVLAHLPAPLLFSDLADTGDLGDWLERESRRPFDLEAGPLFRLHLARTTADDHLLLLTAHHLVANGWSIGILLEELAALYSAAHEGISPTLPEPVPFSAYLSWQKERTGRQAKHEAYWREKLAAPWPPLALPTDHIPTARPRYAGARREMRIEGDLYLALRELAARQGVTLFMGMLAAFQVLLLRLSGQDRITVGVALAEQAAMGAPRLVGHCSSLLPAATDTGGASNLAELLSRVRRTMLEIYDHQEVSLSALALAEPPLSLPTIDAMFNMDRAPALPAFADLETLLLPAPVSHVKFDLSLNVLEVEDGLVLDFDWKTGLFETATAERWAGFFGKTLRDMVADPGISLSDLGRSDADGSSAVLGPAAERVLIDGRPVDPRQVEAVLRGLVDDAIVVVERTPAGAPRLLAYVVLPAGSSLGELRRELGERVPPQFIPATFVQLPGLPASRDPQSLAAFAVPAVPAVRADAGEEGRDDLVPSGETEERLVRAWEEVLGRQGIGLHDDFYQLGGNSLKAVRLALRIERELGIAVGLKELLEAPTIRRLARRLDGRGSSERPAIPRLAEAGPYALSHAQKRLWVLHQRERDSAAYNVTAAAWLAGPLDRAAFHRAFAAVLARHESLRTRVIEQQGEPLQEVCLPAALGPVLEEVDLSREEGPELLLQAIARDESVRPFDLARGPLLRAKLLRLAEDRHAFLLTLHHIVSDGWSLEVMMRDAGRFYRAFSVDADSEADLPLLPIQYRDYAAWQGTQLAADRAGRDFWRRTFAGGPPVLDLPTDFPRPAVQTWNGSTLRFELAADLVADLRRLGEESRASLFGVLLAAVTVLLHQITGRRDLVVGTPFAGRGHPDLENQVGLYINTLALRNRLREDEPFADLLERVRKNSLEAFENAEYPLDLVLEDLDLPRDWSRSPLFDVLLMLESDHRPEPDWGSVALTPFEIDPEVSLFDLSFHFTERETGLDLALLWNRDLFKPERMRALYDRLVHLLRDLASHPGKPIAALGREGARERARPGFQLVSGFNL
ncbi:MAG: hypothetical protein QOJ16_1470 [Acidobacteriota bacterium]|nr:hypothetical protein [Acidobacteriota bacterium]